MELDKNIPLIEIKNMDGEEKSSHVITRSMAKSSITLNPLIRAVRRGIYMTEQYIAHIKVIEKLKITDSDHHGKNIFHLSVRKAELLEFLLKKFEKHTQLKEALRREDIDGHTPAHIAVLHNQRKSIQILARVEQNIYTLRSSKNGRTLMHYAVDSCNPYIVQDILLARPESLCDIDNNGKSPQHYAAALPECILLDFFLAHGANILEIDDNGSTLLHTATQAGSITNVKRLIHDEITLISATDAEGRTPLHIACAKGFRNIVSFLIKNDADPLMRKTGGENCLDVAVFHQQDQIVEELLLSPYWKDLTSEWKNGPKKCFAYLVEKMPNQAKVLLNRCVMTSAHKPISPDYCVTYDFFLLDSAGSSPPAFHGLKAIIKNNEEQCLIHKVCRKYLSIKWREEGCYIFLIDLLLFLCFHISFNVYVALIRGALAEEHLHPHEKARNSTTPRSNYPKPVAYPHDTGPVIASSIILILTSFNIVKEFVQMYSYRWKYLKQMSNYFEWTLFLCVLNFMLPIRETKTERQFGAAAIAICISWFDFIWFLRRAPDIGTYILTLQKTAKTLLKMVTLISLFCMAYASTFYILLAEEPRFENFPVAILSTFVSMLGDFSYDKIFLGKGRYEFYSLKLFIFVFFLLLMAIVINNVLIGLAVGDTQYVMKMAKEKRLKQQIKFLMAVESSLFARLPYFRRRKYLSVYTEYPNQKKSFTDKVKRFLAGEINLFHDEDDIDEDDEPNVLTRQQVDEILKVRLKEHHKKILNEMIDFNSEILEKLEKIVNVKKGI